MACRCRWPMRPSSSPPPNCRSRPRSCGAWAREPEPMKAKDVKAKTTDELNAELEQLTKEVFNLRFQRASGQLENTARVRDVRRDIARIKTILGERRRQATSQATARS